MCSALGTVRMDDLVGIGTLGMEKNFRVKRAQNWEVQGWVTS